MERTIKGRFAKGNRGKQKGTVPKKNALIRAIREYSDEFDDPELEFWKMVYKESMTGDANCRKLIADRLMPALKPVSQSLPDDFDMSPMPRDSGKKAEKLLKIMLDGGLSIEHGSMLLKSITDVANLNDIQVLKTQLAEIKHLLAEYEKKS